MTDTPVTDSLEALKREVGDLLGEHWGGNILARNQMAIDFCIDHLHRTGRIRLGGGE